MTQARSLPRRCRTLYLREAPAADAFRVPVEWREATIVLADGAAKDVRLSLPLDASVRELLEAEEAFLPVRLAESVRIYARSALACITVKLPATEVEDHAMPVAQRSLRVGLRSGVQLEGTLRFVAIQGRARITDVLNEPDRSFALHHDAGVTHIAKAHVMWVEEHS